MNVACSPGSFILTLLTFETRRFLITKGSRINCRTIGLYSIYAGRTLCAPVITVKSLLPSPLLTLLWSRKRFYLSIHRCWLSAAQSLTSLTSGPFPSSEAGLLYCDTGLGASFDGGGGCMVSVRHSRNLVDLNVGLFSLDKSLTHLELRTVSLSENQRWS